MVNEMFNKEEVQNFNKLLIEFLFLRMKKDIFKRISETEGKKAQKAYWELTKSEVWKVLCKKYGSEKANSFLRIIYNKMLDENDICLEFFIDDLLSYIDDLSKDAKQTLYFPNLEKIEKILQDDLSKV